MRSSSLIRWRTTRSGDLDEIEEAHQHVGGTGPGRRYATQQINRAYAVLLSSAFQGFCRDLHSEAVDFLVQATNPAAMRAVIQRVLTDGRKLGHGNANPGNIGADFARLGLAIWDDAKARDGMTETRKRYVESLNDWRNAIAHQDFAPIVRAHGSDQLRLGTVRTWRNACDRLATTFDEVVRAHVRKITGTTPW